MSRVIFAIALAFSVIVGVSAQTTPSVFGKWEGEINISGVKLPMGVTLAGTTAAPTATIDIQGAKGVPMQAVKTDGKSVHLELPAGPGLAVLDGTFDGTMIAGTFKQGAGQGTFYLVRPGAPRPGEVKEVVPYHEEDVTFHNGAITLAGTVTIPEGKGPFPAFVMVTGSGLQNRDEEIFGFRIFRVIADYMTRRGIATLRYDDRGAGGSTGSIAAATTEDFSGDALAGVALLAAHPEIDHAHIGVFGHSEGGAVAAISAAKMPASVGFVIMMAGAAVPGDVVLHQQAGDGARSIGATDDQVARILAAQQKVFAITKANGSPADLSAAIREMITAQLEGRPAAARAMIGDIPAAVEKSMPQAMAQMTNPWMRAFITMDPATFIEKVKCPVYAAFGSKDTQVPPSMHKAPLEAALAKGGNTHLTVKVYPDANHLFIKANTGDASEYAALPKVFVPDFLDDVVAFVKKVSGAK